MEGEPSYISNMATGRKRVVQQRPFNNLPAVKIGQMRNLHVYLWEHMQAKDPPMGDAEVANRLDLNRSTIWKWRQKADSLKPKQLAQLASALDLEDWRELYHLPKPKDAGPSPESVDAIIANAPEHLREAIVEFAKKLANRG